MNAARWRTPNTILICGGLILTIGLGARHNFGLYLQPMTVDLGIGREVFSFAIAIQNLIYGVAQPFTGMIADRLGTARVLIGGAILYAIGLVLMSMSSTSWELNLSAGLLIGIALACGGFSIVFGVVGRAIPASKRTMALGIVGAAGSFGQFVMLPYGQTLITHLGWHSALLVLACTVLLIVPLSAALVEDKKAQARDFQKQSIREALHEAFTHKGYVLLCLGYTVCGFQLMFISVHFPAYLLDQKMSPQVGMTALALIGLFNIFGSFVWGWLGSRYTKKNLLSLLYFTRAVTILAFVLLPLSPATVYAFGASMGFLWLGTVPLTNGLIAQVFGTQYLSTLGGSAFFFHQVGSFMGVWMAGYLFDTTGSYGLMWTLTIASGVLAALLNLPIDEKQIVRPAPAAA
ncbi:MAG TPA: MFS transporter [Burkholderiales bacterium]|nr:MFS transporter [Burkholderiales bacterium]